MTVTASTKRRDYTCDGVNQTFGYNWKIAAATDLKVVVRNLDGVDTTLAYGTDYSVTQVGNSNGGNVVTTAVWPANYHMTVLPNLTVQQLTSFRNQNSFYAWKHEDAFDYVTCLIQQVTEVLGRCMKLQDSASSAAYGMPIAVPGAVWGWDASGNSVAMTSADTLVANLQATTGSGLVGYSSGASYASGTIGAALQAAQPGGAVRPADLSNTTDAAYGSGMVSFNSSLTYAAGTVGNALKNAFNPAIPGAIGGTTPGTGAFTTLSSSGLSTLNSLTVTTTSTFTGAATFSSTLTVTSTATFNARVAEKRNAIAASAIDCSLGNVWTKTISAVTTFTVSNVPASGNSYALILDLTNGGAYTINWWSGVKWSAGTAPTLTASGRDVLGFITHDGGATWSGFVLGKALA